jgi:hypothetical protein
MSCRIIPCSFLAACLVFVGVALWLPGEVASRHQAEPEPEPATSDARLIASECAFFVTFRPGDFLADDLAKAILRDIPKAIEEELRVPADGMARLTVATMRQGSVQIVRTKKAYDAEKLRKAVTEPRLGTTRRAFDKDKAREDDSKPAIGEKKAGGKTIYYAGELQPWTPGWCPLDKTTFVMGKVSAIQALLETKGKPSAEMSDALAISSKHSLVMAMDGKRLRTLFRQQREDSDRERREWQKKREERFPVKDKMRVVPIDKTVDKTIGGRRSLGGPTEVAVRIAPRVRGAVGEKDKDDTDDLDSIFGSGDAALVGLPYKPLMVAKFGLLTLDVGKTDTLTARIDFAERGGTDDGETALKSLLYVASELARILPKHEPEFRGMTVLSDPVRKAFKDAKVERKGTTLSTTLTLTPEAGLATKVREAIEEESKKREKIYKGKDKTTIRDKTTTTEKGRGFDKS